MESSPRLRETRARRAEREAILRERGLPAYTTSAGWLGYDDEKLRSLCREAIADGWTHVKMKVGRDEADDLRRAAILREEIGGDRFLMMDANQVWGVDEAIARTLDWPYSSRSGWRSRRAPTTSSGMPGSRARSTLSASPPASTSTTGSCSSNSCRRTRFATARSTVPACAVSTRCSRFSSWLPGARRHGLPACRRRRPVRVRAASGAVRCDLRRTRRHRSRRRIRRSPPRALRYARSDPRRRLRRARIARVQRRDLRRVARRLPVPRRPRVEQCHVTVLAAFRLAGPCPSGARPDG